MAEDKKKAATKARRYPALEFLFRSHRRSLSLKIDNVWLAAGVSVGAFTLGAFYLYQKNSTEDAVRRALQRETLGVVDPEVTKITDGHSILVELCCNTEWSFFIFLDDFEKNNVKFRLEVELKKIGFNSDLQVTICNKETIDKEVNEIREMYISGNEAGKADVQKGHLENLVKSVNTKSEELQLGPKSEIGTSLDDVTPAAPPRSSSGISLGTFSYPEITAQTVGARRLKRKKDFTGLSPRIPRKTKRAEMGIEKNETSQPAVRTSCPSHVIEKIRQVYQNREGVILPVPWCDEFNFQIEDIFTRLRIVEKEKTRGIATTREVTNMTSIFTPHEGSEQPMIVLIEGGHGIGKTIYSQKLAFDWASKRCREWDESFPRIDVLLLLRCREIKSTLWDAIEEQILPKEIELEEKEMFFQFLKENPSKVLLVLDGLDEADPQKLEMHLKLVKREQLPGCYIVLTSRHKAGSKVRPYTHTLLEIVGFASSDAECYIRKYFQHTEHSAEALILEVKFDKDLRELTQNPLNTLLLCVIFEDLEGTLPKTRTQLYVEVVLFILRRFEYKNGLSNRGRDLLLVYKEELMILGETALDSLRKEELYFDDHKGGMKESLLMKFGFLSIQSGGSKRAPCDRYGFFHRSFQEFFSGYFLALSIIDDVKNSHSVLTNPTFMDNLFHVLKFMSGIVALRSEETAVSIVQSIVSTVNERHEFLSYLRVALYLINECKTCSGDLPTKLVRTLGESLKLVDVVMRPSSLLFTNEVIGTFLRALTFNSTVTNLKLCEGKLSGEVTNLLTEALRVNTSLSSLDLGSNFIGAEGANSLSQALTVNTSLSSLNLSYNSVCDEGANSLSQTLRINTSLSSLDLGSNSISAKGANSLAQALRVNTSLSFLNLCSNSIGDEGTTSLSQVLRVNTSLSSLNLSYNSVCDKGANSLSQTLKINTSLSSLDLGSNSISAKGANSLAQALKVNTSLSSLDLCSNSIGDEGTTSLSQALRVNTSLSSLDLGSNSISAKGANSFAQALRVNTSLSFLNLCSNSIGDEGTTSLSQVLRVNTSLSSLNLSCNSVCDEGANSLSQTLRINTSLSVLNLGSNSIGAEGANSLAQALKVNTSLSSLDLCSNSIGDEGTTSLSQALRVNTSLSSLDLGSNSIGAEGANSLAQALRVNTSLSSLNLCDNSIGAEGTNSLSQALRVNISLSPVNFVWDSIGDEEEKSLTQKRAQDESGRFRSSKSVEEEEELLA